MYYHGQIVHHVYTLYIILVYSSWITSSANLGAMAPELNILVGNPLSIECTLFNTTIEYKKNIYKVNSSLIEFKFKNNYYSEEKTHIKNERKAEISINEASVEDTGIYTCLLKIPGLVHKPLVNVSHVIVGYKPQNVKDFRCNSSSTFRKLSCSWLPKYNPIKTSYNLVLSMKSTLHECDYSPTDNSCDFDIVENIARNLTLRLMGENMFGKNEQYFHINQYSIIKPNAPKNLRHTEVTTNTITLSWEPLEYTQEDKDLFKSIVYVINCIRLKSEADNHSIIIDGIRETSITLTNLIPFNTYEVSLRCRTIQSQSDEYWSEFSTIYVKTKPDIPYLAPVLIPESFQTEKYNEENRSITIFWRPIPNENHNSIDFHYTIEYIQLFNHISRENNSVKHNSININAENTNYTFNNMDSNCAYSFKIYGTNSITKSNNYSQIFVDKNENMPYKPTNIYVFSCGGGKYYIKWKQPPKNNISGAILNYTVFWCQSQISRQLPCKGPIDWIYTTNTSFTTLEFKDMETNYQFAVSANALKSSSGMSWAEYIVPCDERQKMDPPLTERINATTVRIYWSTPILLIDYYLLKLIWMYNKTVSYVYNVSGVQNQYYLTLDCNSYNADYEQQYTVSIVAINTRVSDISDVEYSDSTYLNACFNDDKNGAYIIGLIVGGSLALLLFIMSLYMLLNWMMKIINEFKRLSIELPKGLETIDLIIDTVVEVDNIDRLDDLIRTDSSLNIMSHNIKIVDKPEDSVKNRHDSGISSAYNENIYIKHSLLGNGGLDRKISIDSGHGSSSSSSNMSSDSVVELDTTLQSSKYNNDLQRIRKMSSLPILDENSICNKDSSSGGDSTFLESNKKRNENNQKFKRYKNNKRSTVVPKLNDNQLNHRLCIHSLLSKSEPTIFDSSFREDVSISKSLNNINLNSSITCDSKIGPIYDSNNSSSKSSTPNTSPNYPYYRMDSKRQIYVPKNYIPFNLINTSPEMKTNITANNGYVAHDFVSNNNGQNAGKPMKNALEHDVSQNSYVEEDSSISSNGDNEQSIDIIAQSNVFHKSSSNLSLCEKIENNCLTEQEINNEHKLLDLSVQPLIAYPEDMSLNSSSVSCIPSLSETVSLSAATMKSKTSTNCYSKNSNGYVIPNEFFHLSANNVKAIKPNFTKNAKGYVLINSGAKVSLT